MRAHRAGAVLLAGAFAIACSEDQATLDASSTAPDLGFDDTGNPIRPDASTPDLGFDDGGMPIRADLGFDDRGVAIQPDLGFDDGGVPVRPDLGFDDAGNAVRPDANPLEESLSEFCRGGGTVVQVGAGGQCAGDIAQQTFRFAVCTCDALMVQSTLDVDAYDSSRGLYGAPLAGGGVNVLDDGHLGSNGELRMNGKLTARGGAYVGGGGFAVGAQSSLSRNLYAAGDAVQPNSSSSIGRNAFVDGNVMGRFEIAGDLQLPPAATVTNPNLVRGRVIRAPVPHIRPCACEANELLDIAGLVAFGRTHNDNAVRRVLTSTTYDSGGPANLVLPCGRYYLNRVAQGSSLNVRAQGRVVLFVGGDFNVGGGLTISLDRGAEMDVFITGSLMTQAATVLGSTLAAGNLRVYVGGANRITMNASSRIAGAIYAPRADMVFGASATVYGSIFTRSVMFSGSADVHFDSRIRTAGAECRMPGPDGGVRDAGPAPVDGGPGPADGGMPPGDTGMPPGDTGVTPPPDSGVVTPADSGVPPAPDAGPPGCTRCGNTCGDQACLIPMGQTTGMCGACTSDLDCCAPLACVAGRCTLGL